jgi:FkbM family methyltransferase
MRSSSAVNISGQADQHSKEPSLATDEAGLEQEYQLWLKTFQAADSSYQAFCEKALIQFSGNGQFQQDMYIFFNIFKYWPMKGKKGYFVDSGTNEPLEMNNSLFYEKCLGWKGLCVEPQTKYHEKIESQRSCHLFKGCLASQSMTATMEGFDGLAKVVHTDDASAAGSVQCSPLKEILASQGQSTIDFWSLDVEGAEIDVLSSFDFHDVPVTALLIEDFWVNQRDLDYLVTSKGFIKYRQLAVDSLYLSRSTKYLDKVWEPPLLDGDWNYNKQYRDTVRDKLPKC